jgi:hypothetical protein
LECVAIERRDPGAASVLVLQPAELDERDGGLNLVEPVVEPWSCAETRATRAISMGQAAGEGEDVHDLQRPVAALRSRS